jgi:polyhydroxybutyrate depolymerase
MRRLVISLLLFLFSSSLWGGQSTQQVRVGASTRSYELFAPSSKKKSMPLLLVFHGGGGNARAMSDKTGFNQYAERDGVIVAYLQGLDNQWNDARVDGRNSDDIAFVQALIQDLSKRYPIDASKIFATGHSNGGMMSHTLGVKLNQQFAGIASVAGSMPADLEKNFDARKPVKVMMIHGTQDPLVPYAGGTVARNRGEVASVNASIAKWRALAGAGVIAQNLPANDPEPRDACAVKHQRWQKPGTQTIELVSLYGAGHDWPSLKNEKPNAMMRRLIGPQCRSFDASAAVWKFFFNT